MMLRVWTARLAEGRLAHYLDQVRESVIPHLRDKPGFGGVEFASRALDTGQVEVLVTSRWASTDSAQSLAGSDQAWVPNEIAKLLDDYDPEVGVFELELAASAP